MIGQNAKYSSRLKTFPIAVSMENKQVHRGKSYILTR
jgi:hypothetical protein